MNIVKMRALLLAFACTFSFFATFAQEKQTSRPDNQELFNDFGYSRGNVYRTASGKPGPEYWQNQADYNISVTLDDKTNTIKGNVVMKYTNNSPEDLDYIWMYLEQNRFTSDSRGTLTMPTNGGRYDGDVDGGYTLTNIQAKSGKKTSSKHIISDTRMQVWFDEPIKANGGEAEVSMDFQYKIPQKGMDRMGQLNVADGTIYSMAQWYPRVAVFDDVTGWNVEPYLEAGEFYLEYGNYEYEVTAPYDHVVVGSGMLQNPKDVLTKEQQQRWELAQNSDKTVYIIKPEEVGKASSHPKSSGTMTWEFKMDNTRDVAFGSSKAFIWDAARMNLPEGKKALAQSVYPKESDGQNAWSRSTEYTKAAIEHYSNVLFPYPYNSAVNVASNVGGMEYPGLSFCGYKSTGESLWGVTDHEFGHNWFPMIVGSNERRYAWMDEGFNTFINHYSTLAFNKGEYPSGLDNMASPGITRYLKWDKAEGIDTYPDVSNAMNLGVVAYYKPAIGLVMLRETILGPERFDNAFKSYVKTWAFKHPQPTDFFNHMDNVGGENLSWFWKGWFYGNNSVDIAVAEVKQKDTGTIITLENKGEMPMPISMEITFSDGSTKMVDFPVEIWQRNNTHDYLAEGNKEVSKVTLNPNKKIVDLDSKNDVWSSTDTKSETGK